MQKRGKTSVYGGNEDQKLFKIFNLKISSIFHFVILICRQLIISIVGPQLAICRVALFSHALLVWEYNFMSDEKVPVALQRVRVQA